MEFVENLPEKLKEIRAKPIYRKYIDSMQEIYDNEIENPVYTPNLTDYSEFFKSGGRMNYENKYFLRRKRLTAAAILYLYYEKQEYLNELCVEL